MIERRQIRRQQNTRRAPYITQASLTSNGSTIKTVWTEPILKNRQARVFMISCGFVGIASGEIIDFFIYRGGTDYLMGSVKCWRVSGAAFIPVNHILSEGDKVGGYCPNAANGEIMTVSVFGEYIFMGDSMMKVE